MEQKPKSLQHRSKPGSSMPSAPKADPSPKAVSPPATVTPTPPAPDPIPEPKQAPAPAPRVPPTVLAPLVLPPPNPTPVEEKMWTVMQSLEPTSIRRAATRIIGTGYMPLLSSWAMWETCLAQIEGMTLSMLSSRDFMLQIIPILRVMFRTGVDEPIRAARIAMELAIMQSIMTLRPVPGAPS